MTIQFTVPGRPIAKQRPRAAISKNGKPYFYTAKNTVDYENRVRFAAEEAMQGRQPLQGPLLLVVRFRRTPQKALSKANTALALEDKLRPTVRPDVDNLVKSVKDALNGIAWADDSQIVAMQCDKMYGPADATEVLVREWTP